MAVIPHAIGVIEVDYTPNANREIEASSRQPRRPGNGERAISYARCRATVVLPVANWVYIDFVGAVI